MLIDTFLLSICRKYSHQASEANFFDGIKKQLSGKKLKPRGQKSIGRELNVALLVTAGVLNFFSAHFFLNQKKHSKCQRSGK